MTVSDYVAQPIVIRDIPGVATVEQHGEHAMVNGVPAHVTTARTILDNPQHWLRTVLAKVMPRIEAGEIAAIVHATIEGKDGTQYITITADQWATGAPERERYRAWLATVFDAKAAQQAAEREYDRANNEAGEGYNPHRAGSERTYARNRNVDREYPAGA